MSEHQANTQLLTIETALEMMLSDIIPISQTESISLQHAIDRINAHPVISPVDVPPFDNAAMDGYAVKTHELVDKNHLNLIGKSLAGIPFHGDFLPNSCVRITTGAPIPESTDAVIMQEQTTTDNNIIRFNETPKLGQNIRRAGEDIAKGHQLIVAGEKIDFAKAALLASLGIDKISVFRPIKVALFSTGDELTPLDEPLKEGKIYDTNRFILRLLLEKLACNILDLGIIKDDPKALSEAFTTAKHSADLIITSGGVSVGEADFTKSVLSQIGKINFWKLAIKPGKPFAFGAIENVWFCGLPGNPVSALITFYQLVIPLIAKLSGHSHYQSPMRFKVKTSTPLKKSPGRLEFQRGILTTTANGELSVQSTGDQGSHIMTSFFHANCLIILEKEQGNVKAGEWVTVELFNLMIGSAS